jgi:hypothetical protein
MKLAEIRKMENMFSTLRTRSKSPNLFSNDEGDVRKINQLARYPIRKQRFEGRLLGGTRISLISDISELL